MLALTRLDNERECQQGQKKTYKNIQENHRTKNTCEDPRIQLVNQKIYPMESRKK